MNKRQYAPFIHTGMNAPLIYLHVLAALIPCMCIAVVYYGARAAVLISVSMLSFFLSDHFLGKKLRGQGLDEVYFDLSSLVSGAIFALMLPPDTPLPVVFAGVFFGSVVVKQFFGGVGNNVLNPAIAARLFVALICPKLITGFSEPLENWLNVSALAEGPWFSGNTAEGVASQLYFTELLFGRFAGYIGTGCGILVLTGAVFLAVKRVLKPYSFIGCITGAICIYPFVYYSNFFSYDGLRGLAAFILSSGILFTAVFALADYTTMPTKPVTAAISGVLCGVMTVILYRFVPHDAALCAPVILVNLLTPMLEYFTGPSSEKKAAVSAKAESGGTRK